MRPKRYLGLSVILLALMFTIFQEPRLRTQRDNLSLVTASSREQPAWVRYVMVGLGGFRGLISEILWLRAGRLQEQGRYFEQVQLADWITALDPRAIDAWIFNAWNLSYNISAMMPRYEDRPAWVNSGIALLRDRAIVANPAAPRLYRELGWLYQNKIGDDTDSAHMLYKAGLALEMGALMQENGLLPPQDGTAAALLSKRLVPAKMEAMEKSLGYHFDWRLPQTHSIYWAWSGLDFASGLEHQALRRMIHQNLIKLCEQGRIVSQPEATGYNTAPNLELIPITIRFFEHTIELYPSETNIFARFLAVSIKALATNGLTAEARQSYARLEQLAGTSYYIPSYQELAKGNIPEAFFDRLSD